LDNIIFNLYIVSGWNYKKYPSNIYQFGENLLNTHTHMEFLNRKVFNAIKTVFLISALFLVNSILFLELLGDICSKCSSVFIWSIFCHSFSFPVLTIVEGQYKA
jgi:hypothetical protein